MISKHIRAWLENASAFWFALYASTAAFATYFAMYAYRKPFSAATYTDMTLWGGLDFKVIVVVAQILGYASSKFIGIKVVSEMPPQRRAGAILALIMFSELALVGFAVAPTPLKPLMLFFNGLPLGIIWGLVFGYLEGRRLSEVLGAILCASFIVSSGAVKSIGKALMLHGGVPELWMPAATGLAFVPLLFISVYFLSLVPPPTAADEAARTTRAPMNRAERAAFLRSYLPGIVLLAASYVLFTAFRDFRDNFAAEIWNALGYADAADIFTVSELPVAVFVLVMLAATMTIADNARAFFINHVIVGTGALLIGVSTFLFQSAAMGPVTWMIVSGTGLYMAYVPFNCILFDRMIAVTRSVGTAGFLIYVADASGYAGSVALTLYRNFGEPDLSWLNFFTALAYVTCAAGLAMIMLSAAYFRSRLAPAARAVHG